MLFSKKKRERKRKRLNLKYITKMRRRQHSSQMLQVILLCCNGSTERGADGRTYSEHSMSPSYSRIELGLRTKYCAFWSGRTGGAMVEIYLLSRFVTFAKRFSAVC